MASLSLRNVTFIAHTPLFQNLSLVIGEADRIGLVAANGGGKIHPSEMPRRPHGAEHRRHRPLARFARRLVEQDVPENLLERVAARRSARRAASGRAGKPANGASTSCSTSSRRRPICALCRCVR